MTQLAVLQVSQLVTLATAASAEAFVATFHRANVRLLSSVRSHVLCEGALLIPTLPTDIAHEWFLSSVNAHMNDQMSRAQESLAALLASAYFLLLFGKLA